MVGIVVDDRDTGDPAPNLETPAYAAEARQPVCQAIGGEPELGEQRQRARRVAGHVQTGPGHLDEAVAPRASQAERDSPARVIVDVAHPPRRGRIETVREDRGALGEAAHPGIVDAAEHGSRGAVCHEREGLLERGDIPVVVEMVGLDVGHEEPAQVKMAEGTERLVRLEHEQLRVSEVGTGVEIEQLSTDDEARIEPDRP